MSRRRRSRTEEFDVLENEVMTPQPVTQTMSNGRRVTQQKVSSPRVTVSDTVPLSLSRQNFDERKDTLREARHVEFMQRQTLRDPWLDDAKAREYERIFDAPFEFESFDGRKQPQPVKVKTVSKRVATARLPSRQLSEQLSVVDLQESREMNIASGYLPESTPERFTTFNEPQTKKRKQRLKCPPKKKSGGGLGRKFIPWSKLC